MNKLILLLFIVATFFLVKPSFAQAGYTMMGISDPTVSPSAQDLKDIQAGQNLYNRFQNKKLPCNQIKDDDFEKIGEYIMNQRLGNTNQHIQMNDQAKQMMGENGEEQMHIQMGKNVTSCYLNGQGGGNNMMGWGYSGMMGNYGFGYLGIITWVVVLIDLILLGIWLWKQISKK